MHCHIGGREENAVRREAIQGGEKFEEVQIEEVS